MARLLSFDRRSNTSFMLSLHVYTVTRNGRPASFLNFTCECETSHAHVDMVDIRTSTMSKCARGVPLCGVPRSHVTLHVGTWSFTCKRRTPRANVKLHVTCAHGAISH